MTEERVKPLERKWSELDRETDEDKRTILENNIRELERLLHPPIDDYNADVDKIKKSNPKRKELIAAIGNWSGVIDDL